MLVSASELPTIFTMADSTPQSTQAYTGTCLCGSISLTLTLPYDLHARPQGHICHCMNCRKFSGSATGLACLMLPTSQVQLHDPEGKLKTFLDTKSRSGRTVGRSFCGECGSPVGGPTRTEPSLSVIALGLFDEVPKPVFECFSAQKVDWAKASVEADKQYEYVDEIGQYMEGVFAGTGY